MGYTHYIKMTLKVNVMQYRDALLDCLNICGISGICNIDIAEDGIYVNPKSCDAETMFLGWEPQRFLCCKTGGNANKYDAVVTACYARMSYLNDVTISSDGRPEDWSEGEKLASHILGRKIKAQWEE